MAHWNHRVVKEKLTDGMDWFTVREVYYNDDESISSYGEKPVEICGECVDEIRQYCQWVLNCLDKDILVDGEVKFVDAE